MAKGIYKQKGSDFYWIRYAGPDGKVIRESTKTTNFKEAQAKLEGQRRKVREGQEPERIKTIPNYTFSQLAEEYNKWCERQRSIRSKKGFVLQLVEKFGNVQLRYFNTKMIEQFQSERLLKGNRQVKQGDEWVCLPNKPATINRLLATIKHMFHKGYQWEMCTEETLKRVRQVKLLEENNRRLRYLSREECAALISKCKGTTRDIVITALNTGMRKGEILSLRWENVDLKHGFILLDRTKNGERREIPINDDLRSVLQGITRRLDVPYVFFDSVTGKPYQDVKRSFSTACEPVKYFV
ncbi:MAG: site-specific integrase [Alphaproteobacteria bacterium]|uniref:Site-specific integrase n=1 Tax=Candidatus Nitrobium versatile TaxID=2884831 RepID=A0A953M279_9BACT|nr:site-specific integrase [Candidatus Nitrobium versatile]